MSYNEKLADRVRELIAAAHKNVEEKKMFGGLCFMVNDKMCVGVEKERMMVRFDPARYDEVMQKKARRPEQSIAIPASASLGKDVPTGTRARAP